MSDNLIKFLLVIYFLILVASIRERNWPRVIYWFAAMQLLISVLWGMK